MNNFTGTRVKDHYESSMEFDFYLDRGLIECEKEIFSHYVNENDIVLDAGCYVGRVSFVLAKMCKKVFGIDIANSAIEKAEKIRQDKGIENCDFKSGSIADLPYEDAFFDKVLMPYNTIEVVGNKQLRMKTLQESFRVLKKDGLFIFSTHNRYFAKLFMILWFYNIIRAISFLNKKLAIGVISLLKKKYKFVDEFILQTEWNTIIAREVDAHDKFACYIYGKRIIKKELSKVGFIDVEFFPIEEQNPSTESGRAAGLLPTSTSNFSIPGFYVVAKK